MAKVIDMRERYLNRQLTADREARAYLVAQLDALARRLDAQRAAARAADKRKREGEGT